MLGANLDFQKIIYKHRIRIGADMQLNDLTSTATRQNIVVDTSAKWSTRFPDGENKMNNYAAYISHTWIVNDQLTITDGIRAGYSTLHSTLEDTVVLPDPLPAILPYKTIDQNPPAWFWET